MRITLPLGALIGVLSLLTVDLFLLIVNGFEPVEEGRIFMLPVLTMVLAPLAVAGLLVFVLRKHEFPQRCSKTYLQVWLCASASCVLLTMWAAIEMIVADVSGMIVLFLIIAVPVLLVPALAVTLILSLAAIAVDWKLVVMRSLANRG